MTCFSEYVPQLHERRFRVTVRWMAIMHILRPSQTHHSPTEVYELAQQELPGLTETTVYRTLKFLARIDLIITEEIAKRLWVFSGDHQIIASGHPEDILDGHELLHHSNLSYYHAHSK